MRKLGVALLAVVLAGCTLAEKMTDYSKWQTGDSKADAQTALQRQTQASVAPVVIQPLNPTPGKARPGDDPAPQPQQVQKLIQATDPTVLIRPQVNLSIYQFMVPAGTISGDRGFWKRVDEASIDTRTHDILDRNGIRVGLAPLSEMERLMSLMDKYAPEARPAVYAAAGTKAFELPMKRQVPHQIIYHFQPDGQMPVRTYENSENLLCVQFQAAPRKPGDVRVEICPMVRSLRRQLVAVNKNDEREIEYVSPESFFDLSLLTDIPLDGFLVLSPAAESASNMSLGHAFFMGDSEAGQKETVILMIPQAMQSTRGEKIGQTVGATSRPK